MRKGKLRLRAPQAADCTSQPSPGAYCVQRAAGRAGSGCSHPSSPPPPPPSPAGPLPRPGRKWEKWTGKKSWAEPTPPHSPPPPLPSHADPCGSGPQNPGVRGRDPVPPSGPQMGGGTWKAGKTTAQPAPRQPLPPLRPWRSGRRRLLYIISGGQVGCFIEGPGSPADPSSQLKACPRVPSAAGQTEARGGPAPGPRPPPPRAPPHPQQPGQPRPTPASLLAVRTALPAPAAILPRPRRRGQSPRPPRTRLCAEAGGLFIWRPPPPPPRGARSPRAPGSSGAR